MIDFEGLPLPDDVPPPGACVRVERPEPGLAIVVLDPPHRPKIAVLDMPVLRDLELAIGAVERDPSLRGLVLTGREPLSFAAGADVDAIAGLRDPAVATRIARVGHSIFDRIHALGKRGDGRLRTVAAVGGAVPGGAYELALTCDRIVLADDEKSRVGLPETRLGILPGWGGTQRLPRRVGVPAALEAILSGRLYGARQALRKGLVDRLAHPQDLVRVASDIALGRARCDGPDRGWKGWLVDKNPLALALIRKKTEAQLAEATGGHYPAPPRAADLVLRAPGTSLAEGLAAEARALGELATSPESKSLVRIFQLSEAAKKLAGGGSPDGAERARPVTRGGVVGGGVMGGAIASLMAERGATARLCDLDRRALDAAQHDHRREIAKKLRRRQILPHVADAAIDRLQVTTELVGFARAELVIEAVAERLDVKGKVLGVLAEQVPADAILATNTSSLSVDAMAAQLPHPERFVGIHFFNPVRKMPLVEIVRGERTSDETVRRAARFALDLGKTPLVVRDVAGFLVNRLLGPYLDEAVRLFEDGADVARVDAAAQRFGMPMGPFELLDEVGLDVASHAARSLSDAYGERMTTSAALAKLVERGELGKKTGAGIRRWRRGKSGKQESLGQNPAFERSAQGGGPAPSDEEIVDRLILAMVNEAARCLDEGVVAGPDELDLGSVLGMGFAPFRGGLLRYADARGTAAIVARLRELAADPRIASRPGGTPRFDPAPRLVALAEQDGRFHAAAS